MIREFLFVTEAAYGRTMRIRKTLISRYMNSEFRGVPAAVVEFAAPPLPGGVHTARLLEAMLVLETVEQIDAQMEASILLPVAKETFMTGENCVGEENTLARMVETINRKRKGELG